MRAGAAKWCLGLHLIKINDASAATSTLHIALVNTGKVMALSHYLSSAKSGNPTQIPITLLLFYRQ